MLCWNESLKGTTPTDQSKSENAVRRTHVCTLVQITAKSGQGPNLSQHIRDRTINVLKQQPGFIDMVVLKSDGDPNQFVGISLWKNKEEAEKFLASQQWQRLLQEFRPLVQGDPIIRTFNVDASTMHNVGIARPATSS